MLLIIQEKSTETKDMETFTLTFGKEIQEFTDTIGSFKHASGSLYKNRPSGSASHAALSSSTWESQPYVRPGAAQPDARVSYVHSCRHPSLPALSAISVLIFFKITSACLFIFYFFLERAGRERCKRELGQTVRWENPQRPNVPCKTTTWMRNLMTGGIKGRTDPPRFPFAFSEKPFSLH